MKRWVERFVVFAALVGSAGALCAQESAVGASEAGVSSAASPYTVPAWWKNDKKESGVVGLDVDELLRRCAPSVHPETMRAVLNTESRGNVLAVADAGPVALPWSQRKAMVRSHYPADKATAVRLAKDLVAQGHTVSLGLAQINDRNLARLGMPIESIFEPCANISAGDKILSSFYANAVKSYGPGARALRAALSAYNSGNFVRGEQDGYVDLVFKQAGRPLVLKEGSGQPAVPSLASATGAQPGFARVSGVRRVDRRNTSGTGNKDFTLLVSAFDNE